MKFSFEKSIQILLEKTFLGIDVQNCAYVVNSGIKQMKVTRKNEKSMTLLTINEDDNLLFQSDF